MTSINIYQEVSQRHCDKTGKRPEMNIHFFPLKYMIEQPQKCQVNPAQNDLRAT